MHSKKTFASARTLLLAGAVSACLTACFRESPEQLLADAKVSLTKHEDRKAEIDLKNALRAKPELGEARFLLGKLLLDRGDAVGAGIELDKAARAGFKGDGLVAAQAKVLLVQGGPEKVLAQYGKTELSDPATASQLKTTLANAAFRSKDATAGRAFLDQALKLQPDNLEAQLLNVRVHAASDGVPAGLTLLDPVLKAHDNSSKAWLLKGELLAAGRKDIPGATEAFRNAVRRDKMSVGAHSALMLILLEQGDKAGAKAELAAFKAAMPNQPLQKYFSASDQLESGDLKGARETIQALLKQAPDDARVLTLAGSIEMARGSVVQAETYLSKAAFQAPDNPKPKILLARVQLQQGEATNALKTLEPLLQAQTPDADTLSLAGQAYLQLNQFADAQAAYTKVAALLPGDVRSRIALALIDFSKPGQQDKALGELKALALQDKGTSADMVLISALGRRGDFAGALGAIDALEKKAPGKPDVPFMRGGIDLQKGDKAAARASFEAALKLTPNYVPAVRALASLDLDAGKPEDAAKRYEALATADPSNVAARMALFQIKQQRLGAGRAELQKILTDTIVQNPTAIPPRAGLVRFDLQNRDAGAALSAAQDALAALPDNPEAVDLVAEAQAANGQTNQALSMFNRVVTLQPNAPAPLMRLAEFQASTKDWASALQNLQRARALAPDSVEVQIGLVRALQGVGRKDDASALIRSIQEHFPKSGAGFNLEGEAALADKQYTKAVVAFRTSLDRSPNGETAVRLISALTMGNDKAGAASFQASWLKAHPKDVAVQYFLGDLALSRGDRTGALAHYQAVLQVQPENVMAMNNVAWLMSSTNPKEALEMAEAINKRYPDQAPFMDTLATVLAASGKPGDALDLQKRAVDISPDIPLHRLHLAQYYLQQGKKPEAKIELEKLAALGDKFSQQTEVKKLLMGL